MKTERTEDLIVALASDAAPVAPLPPLRTRLWRWLGLSTACSGAGVLAFSPRPDLASVMLDSDFAGDAVLTLGTGVLAAASAFTLSVPGAEGSRAQRWLPIAALGSWAAFLAWRLASDGQSWAAVAAEPWHLACGVRMLAIGVLPAIAAFVMLRRAAPLEPGWTAVLASLAALAIATIAVQIACPIGVTTHVIVSHVTPLLALSVSGGLLGSRVLGSRVLGFRF